MCSYKPNCPICNHYEFIYNRPIFCPDCSVYSTYKALDESFKQPPPLVVKKTSVRPPAKPLAKRQKTMTDSEKVLQQSWANMQ